MILRNRIILAISFWLCFVLLYIGIKGVIPGWSNITTDFNNYYASSKLYLEGDALFSFYDNDSFSQRAKSVGVENGAKFAPFTPLTTFVFIPIASLDLLTAKRIWLLFNVLLLFCIPFQIKKIIAVSLIESILILSLFFVPLSSNFDFGQIYLFLVFLILAAMQLFFLKKKKGIASIIIAICTLLKYFPVLFLAYFLLNKSKGLRWVFVFVISCISLVAVVYFIDSEVYEVYLSTFVNHINGDLSGQGKFAIEFQSIDAFLNNVFVYDAVENPTPVFAMTELKSVFKWGVLALVGVACFHLFFKAKFKFNLIDSSIFIIGTFTLIPASASYHFLFLILPLASLLGWFLKEKNQKGLVLFVSLILGLFVIQFHHIPEMDKWPMFNLFIHFPRMWIAFLLFIFLYLFRLKRRDDKVELSF